MDVPDYRCKIVIDGGNIKINGARGGFCIVGQSAGNDHIKLQGAETFKLEQQDLEDLELWRNDLVRDLQKYQGMTLEISQLIADDQTRKMNAFLNVRRMKKMGVKKFEWVHVASSHPRKLHEELNGKIFSFDDPPIIQKDPEIRGLPAQLFNCHCQMVPVFDFEERE